MCRSAPRGNPPHGTVGSAAALGISDHVGRLQPGVRANCVLLDGDPLADLEALKNSVSLVVKEGPIVYQRDKASAGRWPTGVW